jgi:hypothetical protein
MTATFDPIAEEITTNNMDFVDLYEELETLKKITLSGEIVEQQLKKFVVEMESAMEWQDNVTRDEISMGDQDDLSIDICE